MAVEMKSVTLETPDDVNVIVGQSHFIKTLVNLYEACMNSSPQIEFGVAFAEASGDCLIRADGNQEKLKEMAVRNLQLIGASHCFIIALKNAYPINILNAIKMIPEVCTVFGASANTMQVIIAETEQGRGVMGVVDGFPPQGVEADSDAEARNRYLRNLGYKR